MERPQTLIVAASALFLGSLVELSPSFLAPTSTVRTFSQASLRGVSAGQAANESIFSTSVRSSMQVASAVLTLSACALASRRRNQSSRVRMFAETEKINPHDDHIAPTSVYCNALMDGAAQKSESVTVTKDVMKVRNIFENTEFMDECQYVLNNPIYKTDLLLADKMIELFGPFESSVFPKFVHYLGKKRRIKQLKAVCGEYMRSLYMNQEITPVLVKSAQRLSDEQKQKIKNKMVAKIGGGQVKLIEVVDPGLVAGLRVEWGYVDPDKLKSPSHGIDLSMRNVVKQNALKEGVTMENEGAD